MDVNPTVIEAILVSGIGGISVRVLTNLIKNWLKVKGFLVYLISLAVCAGATAVYLVASSWNWWEFAIYTAFVFLAANGFYRASHKS